MVKQNEQPEVCARRFFILEIKVPADPAREVPIECIRKAVQGHKRSRIHSEYIITFTETEARNSIKSYANGLAGSQGMAGLRLELTDNLKGSYRILEEDGYSVRERYGKENKRNIKFEDRNKDLMMNIGLPESTKWHNITIDQARKARNLRQDVELSKLKRGKTIAGPAADREREPRC